MYDAGWVGVAGRGACCEAPEFLPELVLDGCAPGVDECALEVDFFAGLLVAARVDLLDGITRTTMAGVTKRLFKTHQSITRRTEECYVARRSPDFAESDV